MEALRRAQRLTRLVLAWFALSVGIAVAAPVLQPLGDDVICSGSSAAKSMASEHADAAGGGHHHMKDCASCALTGVPSAPVTFAASTPPADMPAAVLPTSVAVRSGSPFSARAPPRV
jgi:hypothetical protein